jgi:predicted lipid-binding transport protein (Tim44 family)
VYYRLVSTPWGSGLLSGLVFGAVMGVLSGLDKWSLDAALVVGLLSATTFGAIMGVTSMSTLSALAGLPPADRATVMRAVKQGEVTSDRRLAPALVAYADSLRRRYRSPSASSWRWLVGGAAAVLAFIAVDDAREGEWVWAAARMACIVAILRLPGRVRRAEERRDRAARSARALLDPPS